MPASSSSWHWPRIWVLTNWKRPVKIMWSRHYPLPMHAFTWQLLWKFKTNPQVSAIQTFLLFRREIFDRIKCIRNHRKLLMFVGLKLSSSLMFLLCVRWRALITSLPLPTSFHFSWNIFPFNLFGLRKIKYKVGRSFTNKYSIWWNDLRKNINCVFEFLLVQHRKMGRIQPSGVQLV